MEKLLENWMENLDGKYVGKFGWKNVLKMLGENVGWKCWLKMLVEHLAGNLLVNGCEIIGEKIVASNLPLRLSTTLTFPLPYISSQIRKENDEKSCKMRCSLMSLTETRPDLDHQFGYLDWHQSM